MWEKVEYAKLTPEEKKVAKSFAKKGELSFLLHPGQKRIYDAFQEKRNLVTVLNIARRFGKSFLMIVLCLEQAIKFPKSQIWYASPTYAMTRDMVVPTMKEILDFFPVEWRPTKSQDKWKFPNGSVITTVGVDRDNGDKLRGKASHLTILDEAGLMKDLGEMVQNNAIPPLLTTKGRLILVSTPPATTAHDFTQVYIPDAKADNAYFEAKWYENPLLSEEDIIEEVLPKYPGGFDNPNFKREYLADYNVTDADRRVVPEFIPSEHEAWLRSYTPPQTFQRWVGMDFGFNNHSSAVFGYTDFQRGKLVICGEVDMQHATLREFAQAIQSAEAKVWPTAMHGYSLPEVRRIADNADPGKPAEMAKEYNMYVDVVHKTTQPMMINQLRQALDSSANTWQVVVDTSKCPLLTAQLEQGIWNKSKTDYEHKRGEAHLDLLDALKYLVMEHDFNKNPFTGARPTGGDFFRQNKQTNINNPFRR